jgi:hypothetical protein
VTAQLPRPALLAIVGVVAVVGLFFVSRRGGEETVPASPAPAQTAPAESPSASSSEPDAAPADDATESSQGLPPAVDKALDAKKTVVLLFWNKSGVDDRSVKGSVDRLSRRGGKVAKFTDTVNNLAKYTRITSGVSVTTTPSVVVVNSRGQAEVLSGYNDFQTIDQFVSNASRRK